MKQLLIERFENGYAFCSEYIGGKPVKKKGKDAHFFAIEKEELPSGVDIGTLLTVTDNGELVIAKNDKK